MALPWTFPGALVLAALVVTARGALCEAVQPPAEDLIAGPPAGPWRRLFIDAMVVERAEGLQRVFHAATRHPANPIITADKPWEQYPSYGGPYLYGTVVWDEGKLRMWYHVHASGYANCYAESTDGIHWTKPNLGLVPYGDAADTNIFLHLAPESDNPPPFRSAGQCHNPSVIKQSWESDPARRYALFCYGVDYHHARVAYSPDGLRWTFVPETAEKGLFSSGDVLNFFHDPYQGRYVATFKTGNRRGRAAGVVVSQDGLQWAKPVEGPVFGADDLDPDATQVYGMPVFPYQGMYVGLPWIYNARWMKTTGYSDQGMYLAEKSSPCTMDVQLAWSWDLINWTRPPERTQFIPRGAEGEFDSGMIYTARAPVQIGDELWFYYGGWDGPHNSTKSKANIGVATLRLEGFCSMSAGAQEGWLISRLEKFFVPRVTINAACRDGGSVVAEVLDADDKVIPGFSREDCVPFTGDSVRHVFTWRTEALPQELAEAPKKLRFYLRNAHLYSYLPDQTTGPQNVVWDPSANGGLPPDDPGIPESRRFDRGGLASGFSMGTEGALSFVDLSSVGDLKTNAIYKRDLNWSDDDDWCVETWLRVVDAGDEPPYGLSVWFRPDTGRNAAIYISAGEVGIQSSFSLTDHRVLRKVPMDTTDAFHWYRLVHEGGAEGTVALLVDGTEVIRMAFAELSIRTGRGGNIMFGPNASSRTGRLQVARFGYRIGTTDLIFGPVTGSGAQ